MKNSDEVYNEIKELFGAGPELPEKLSKENVVKMVEKTKPQSVSRISLSKKMIVAASFAVFLLCCGVVLNGADLEILDNKAEDVALTAQAAVSAIVEPTTTQAMTTTEPGSQSAEGAENVGSLRKAQSRQEIEELMVDNMVVYYAQNYNYMVDGVVGDYTVAVTMAAPDSNKSAAIVEDAATEGNSESYGETNVQVKGVDEADIIKNDGRYIYTVGRDKSGFTKLRIVDSESKSLVYNGYVFDDMSEIVTVSEIYLYENTLVVMGVTGTVYQGYNSMASKGFIGYRLGGNNDTVIALYDITDKSAPSLIRANKQSGAYQSSRMVDGVLYTLTDYYVSGSDEEEIKYGCIPKVNGMEIACDCIYIMNEDSTQYVCLSALNVKNGGNEMNSLAVLGGGETVYCSQNNFYVVSHDYYNNTESQFKNINGVSTVNVFSLNGTQITLAASGEVPGRVLNQYSLDEYKGYLRVATTYYNYQTQRTTSSLYVLDEKMDIVGKLEDIAKNEEIKSVRFKGDTAYLVTYENTDPFFVIDLSKPDSPALDGELKIPGYSTYLHDVSDTLVIGIGYGGNDESADISKLKISLFDVSDRNSPKEVDSIIVEDSYSYVNSDARFFLYNSQEKYIALPVSSFNSTGATVLKYYIIDVKEDGLETRHILDHSDNGLEYYFRGTYIGNTFYTFSDYLANAFDLTSGENVWECEYYDASAPIVVTTTAEVIVEETTKRSLWDFFTTTKPAETMETMETTADSRKEETAVTVTSQAYNGAIPEETTTAKSENEKADEVTTTTKITFEGW